MLRAFLIFLCFAALPVLAQTSVSPPDTVLTTIEAADFPINTHQFVWLDNDTLIFEPQRHPDMTGAYEYRVSTDAISHLEVSPLYFAPTPKRVEHYQIATDEPNFAYNSFRSPFAFSSTLEYPLHRVIYLSSLRIACGFDCPDRIVMAGVHDDQPDYTSEELNAQTAIAPLNYILSRTYHPLSLKAAYSLSVFWARSANAAVVEVSPTLGIGARLYYANLRNQSYDQHAPEIYIDDVTPELGTYLYALSDDGTRVIYGKSQPEDAYREALQIWQVIPASPEAIWSAQVLPSFTILPQSSSEDAFAGANFIPGDTQHVPALHADGILRINIETNEREMLNPDINMQWIKLGVFSPDNRYVAVVTQDDDVIVLPTGIE